jgi:hypothetical protein
VGAPAHLAHLHRHLGLYLCRFARVPVIDLAQPPPEKRSLGTRLIETLGKQLKGDVQLTNESTGFVYAFDVPIASLTSLAA